MYRIGQVLAGAAAAAAFSFAAFAGPQYVNRDAQGLSGFDAVAYHTVGEATEGSEEFTAQFNDVTWLFASAENRDLFLEDPDRYVPAYDGHCAFAMANDRKVAADPEVWRIVDGRLYVNFNTGAQNRWQEDIPGFIEDADAAFIELEDEPAANPRRRF